MKSTAFFAPRLALAATAALAFMPFSARAGIKPGSKDLGAIWFVGDSITQSNADGDANGSPRKSLQERLTAAGYTFSYTGHHTDNVDGLPATGNTPADNLWYYHSGISGSVITDDYKGRTGMTQHLPDFWKTGRLAKVKPNVVLVMLGTNDVDQALDVKGAPGRLRKLVNAIAAKAGDAKPSFFVSTIAPNHKNEAVSAATVEYNKALPDLVAKLKADGRDVTLVDAFTALNDKYSETMMPDNLHPNATGNAAIATAWGTAIDARVANAAKSTAPKVSRGLALLAGKRVLILGDSITQAGGYVSFMDYLLQKQNPTAKFDIISIGLASEAINHVEDPGHAGGAFPHPNLQDRLGRALTAVKPDVVFACYGMNDGIYKAYDATRMEGFREGTAKLAKACTDADAQLVLVTPPVFDFAKTGFGAYPAYDAEVLGKFAKWQVSTPPVGVTAVVDLHKAMAADLAARKKADKGFAFAADGVHPGELGHLIMALTVMKGLGIPVPAGTPEKLLKTITTDPLWDLVNKRRDARSTAWLNHVGYSREKTVAPGTGDIAASEAEATARQLDIDKARKAGVK